MKIGVQTMKSKAEKQPHPEENLKLFEAAGQEAGSKPARSPEDGTDVDEPKQSDKPLAELQALNLALFNSTNDMIWSVDPQTFALVTFNRALEDYFFNGLGIKIKPGMTPDDLLPPKAAAQWREFYRYALRDGAYATEYLSVDGTNYLLLSFSLLKCDGNVFGISVFGKNITERKLAEQALEERLRFERLLSGLSARFVDIPPDRVDAEIEQGLKQILEFFKVDRCGLIRVLPGKGSWQITHVALSKSVQPVPVGVELPTSTHPWVYHKLIEKGEVVSVSRPDDLPAEANVDKQTWIGWGTRSTLHIPILIGEAVGHAISINSVKSETIWPEELFPRLRLLGEIFIKPLKRKQMEEQLREHLREIEELKQRLEKENICLQEEVNLLTGHTEIVGRSLAMRRVLSQAEQVAPTDSTVLIQGETGTGKELVARAIHRLSSRKNRPLVTVNCASLPPALIESELFGREKGAYTGALSRMAGRFELADGSTLFLDEIGELPLDVQGKLLRVLEDGSFERLGSTKTLHVNVRIIAATNRDLDKEVKAGRFRKDLYYRLNVFPIAIPPLRERPEDIPLMVTAFVGKLEKRMGKEIETISKKTMHALQSYSWPGNVWELKNIIEHAMILSKGHTLVVHLPNAELSETDVTQNLHEMERLHVVSVLEKVGWRLSGKGGAAEALGLKRTTLQARMKKLGIKRPNT
jgi:formate hydrogenlyase transcriptional activator